MSGPLRVERDVEVGRWIQDALAEDGTVAAIVPDAFEAYARVLHPASIAAPHPEGPDPRWPDEPRWGEWHPLRWARSGELLEREPREGPWADTFGDEQLRLDDGSLVSPPESGEPPLDLLTAILETVLDEQGDAEVLAGVWEGRGLDPRSVAHFSWEEGDEHRSRAEIAARAEALTQRMRLAMAERIDPEVRAAMRDGAVLGLPREGWGRGHVLLRARLRALVDPAWVELAGLGWPAPQGELMPGDGRTPNILWPTEPQGAPAWMVATDLDVDSTIVAGSARLVDRILADDRLEAVRATPATRIA